MPTIWLTPAEKSSISRSLLPCCREKRLATCTKRKSTSQGSNQRFWISAWVSSQAGPSSSKAPACASNFFSVRRLRGFRQVIAQVCPCYDWIVKSMLSRRIGWLQKRASGPLHSPCSCPCTKNKKATRKNKTNTNTKTNHKTQHHQNKKHKQNQTQKLDSDALC